MYKFSDYLRWDFIHAWQRMHHNHVGLRLSERRGRDHVRIPHRVIIARLREPLLLYTCHVQHVRNGKNVVEASIAELRHALCFELAHQLRRHAKWRGWHVVKTNTPHLSGHKWAVVGCGITWRNDSAQKASTHSHTHTRTAHTHARTRVHACTRTHTRPHTHTHTHTHAAHKQWINKTSSYRGYSIYTPLFISREKWLPTLDLLMWLSVG